MKYIRIDVAGEREGYTASVTKLESLYTIAVTIATPDGDRTHRLDASARDQHWLMADLLPHVLDGGSGTERDVQRYCEAIRHFADPNPPPRAGGSPA